eukprot:CAMPEP_0183721390 /NCGR_PEP_ID=MMETSP0737-20130205/13683_1 /TAXON_ID=385413 /ORGANISM="Thalassiosira miniscula, Strain CCMP1093" /LENGTH=451 /DNA_ID=CAMNT_0025951393 /DNA_START=103 /DNA_END=1458 /DNA_ORIENTATION=+
MRLAGLVFNASKSQSKYTNNFRHSIRHESSTPVSAPVRQAVTKEERAARRAARKERANAFMSSMGAGEAGAVGGQSESAAAAAGKQAQKATSSASGPTLDVTRLGWYAAVLIPTAFIGWGIADDESPPARLSRMVGLTDKIEEFSKPARAKLLPDWNQIPNIPPDFPAPPTLVVDLENTLVSSTWDRKYGWRHAKRPGVDKFLATMAQYYEIVIFSPSPDGLALPVVDSLDSKGYAMHRLFRDSTNYHNAVHCKDLSWLNRPLRKIIALDDDPAALQFQPENLIRVKPYDNPNLEDNTLERITPLLVEISREGYDDIPGLLRQFQGMDADEIADEHERRVNDLRTRREQITQRGLGSFASSKGSLPPPELPPNLQGSGGGQAQQLTSKDLVGSAPAPEASESGVMGWLQRRQKQQEEHNKEKFGLWNEVMMKKQAEKKKKLDEQQQAQQAA